MAESQTFWLKWGSLLLVAYSVEITARCHNPLVLFLSYWASILFIQISEGTPAVFICIHVVKISQTQAPSQRLLVTKVTMMVGPAVHTGRLDMGYTLMVIPKSHVHDKVHALRAVLGQLPAAGVQNVAFLKSLELEDKLREVWRVSVFLWFKQNFLFLRLGCNHTEDRRFTAPSLVLVHFIVKCPFIL